MRMDKEQLNEIKAKYNVDELWSFSKVHCYEVSPYNYFLKYIKHIKETDKTSIYSESGSSVHSILEKFYNGEIAYEQMIGQYNESLTIFNIADLKYNKSDVEKNAAIANKYEECIKHFLCTHQKIPGKTRTEEFLITKVGKYVFQGYADMIGKIGDQWTIYDFKTSTKYTGDKIILESAQLLLYVQSLMQHGIALENINCCWDFCKYVHVKYLQKNGKYKERDIERNALGTSLAASAKTKLKDAKYHEDEINNFIEQMILTNSITCLPKDIAQSYELSDCLIYVPLTQEIIDNFNTKLLNTLNEIEEKTQATKNALNEEEQDLIWWDSDELLKSNSYYHMNLNGYTKEQHKPWGAYCKKMDMGADNNNDIFYQIEKSRSSTGEVIDLSWLEEFA